MKIKQDNKPLIIVIIIVVIIGVLMYINIKDNKSTDYSNLSDEERAVAVQNEISQMQTNKLSTMGERDRMEYYVSTFIEAVENEEYEKAYSMLYDDFKKNYFPTLAEFEEYAKNTLPSMLSLDHTNFERNGDYYILWVTMSNPLGGKDSSKEMNFIIQENGLNDFVMSFSVI